MVLEQFDTRESETGESYESFLRADEVAPHGQVATILGFGEAVMEDKSKKPYVLLSGVFGKAGAIRRTKRVALILKRTNGAALARAARSLGSEAALHGATVSLTLGTTFFRGKDVPTIDLTLPEQSHP